MSNLVPFTDIEKMAEVATKSKMFGFKNQEEAMAIMLLCQAEGLHPAIAMRDYHVIQGRPALKADAMLARFQQAGGSVQWKEYTDEKVTGLFTHPQGGTLELTWTLAQAKAIGIANKDNWRNYPRAMLRARVISEGIRSVYPGCVVGVYTPEEVQDFQPSPAKDMGMAVEVKPDTVTVEEEEGAFKLYVPNMVEAYSSHYTHQEWIDAYAQMAARINNSPKIPQAEKDGKLKALAEENKRVTESFNSEYQIKIRAALATAGVNVSPKSLASQFVEDMELSEKIF